MNDDRVASAPGAARRMLRPETIRAFTTRAHGNTSRAIGWDTPSGNSSSGAHFSQRSFGHTGFTGTSIWIDPERDLFVVLLTNRVNPSRANQKHIAIRRAVHDAVQEAIIETRVTGR
jgi:CubicO group peptidase (beta-lactamase class C family)